jgi:hypothetical protein
MIHGVRSKYGNILPYPDFKVISITSHPKDATVFSDVMLCGLKKFTNISEEAGLLTVFLYSELGGTTFLQSISKFIPDNPEGSTFCGKEIRFHSVTEVCHSFCPTHLNTFKPNIKNSDIRSPFLFPMKRNLI